VERDLDAVEAVAHFAIDTEDALRTTDAKLREALTVGRPVQFAEPDRLDDPEFRAVG
jgi:hypothetical protein